MCPLLNHSALCFRLCDLISSLCTVYYISEVRMYNIATTLEAILNDLKCLVDHYLTDWIMITLWQWPRLAKGNHMFTLMVNPSLVFKLFNLAVTVPLLSYETYASKGVIDTCFQIILLIHSDSFSMCACLMSCNSVQVATHKVL